MFLLRVQCCLLAKVVGLQCGVNRNTFKRALARERAYHISAISYLTIAQDGFWHADPNPWQQCPATVHSASHPGSSLNRSGVDTTPTTSTASATNRIILHRI